MMRLGIPEDRLPRTLLRAEIDRIVALGVDLRLNTPLAADFGLAQLRALGFGTFAIFRVLPSGRAVLAGLIVDGKRVD